MEATNFKTFSTIAEMTSQNGGPIDFSQISETLFCATIEFFIKACHKINKNKQVNEEKCEKEFLLLIIIYSKWLSIDI